MNIKSQIPNLFTLSNLLSGLVAIYFVSTSKLEWASMCILIGAGFDFLDGMIARALGVSGDFGKQLDSLADMVTFGLAPSFIAMYLAGAFNPNLGFSLLAFAPAIMAPFSAYRLAKFNLDTRQTNSFIGVPTPANALFWLSIPLILSYTATNETALGQAYLYFANTDWLIGLVALAWSILLVCELPLLALKFKSFAIKENKFRYLLIIFSAILLALLWVQAIPIILLLYILLSVIESLIKK